MKNRGWIAVFLVLLAPAWWAQTSVFAKSAAAITSAATIDLNSASLDQLNALPGVGAVKAQAIIDGRPYSSIDDFVSKGIVSKSAYDKFKDLVTVSVGKAKKASTADPTPPEPVGPIDLNTASVDELEALPGIGPVKAKAIIDGRPYSSVGHFASKGIVTKSALDKLIGVITVVPSPLKSTPNKTYTSADKGTPAQIAEYSRIRVCGAKWRSAKAAGEIATGQTWPKFWSLCNAQLKQQGN